MKYNKIIKLTGYVIVIYFFFIDTQYCSERPLLSRMFVPIISPQSQYLNKPYQNNDLTEMHHAVSHKDGQSNRDVMREKYLDKYSDYDIVVYWTSDEMLQRIKLNEPAYEVSTDEILDCLIDLDISLKDDKEDIKQMLYQKECNKIISNDRFDSHQKNNLYEHMLHNEEKVKDELWLQHIYSCKDAIHKEIEKNKGATSCQKSYYAWPYIKEIARLRKFSWS